MAIPNHIYKFKNYKKQNTEYIKLYRNEGLPTESVANWLNLSKLTNLGTV